MQWEKPMIDTEVRYYPLRYFTVNIYIYTNSAVIVITWQTNYQQPGRHVMTPSAHILSLTHTHLYIGLCKTFNTVIQVFNVVSLMLQWSPTQTGAAQGNCALMCTHRLCVLKVCSVALSSPSRSTVPHSASTVRRAINSKTINHSPQGSHPPPLERLQGLLLVRNIMVPGII